MRKTQATHGRPVGKTAPKADRCKKEIDEALASVTHLRNRKGGITVEELRSAREEGRRS